MEKEGSSSGSSSEDETNGSHQNLKKEPAHSGERLMAAMLHFLPDFGKGTNRSLARAWRCVNTWRRLCPSRSRRPHPKQTWFALATDLAGRGLLQMALLALMGLSGYFRPHEVYGLSRRCLVPPQDGITEHWSVLLFPLEDGVTSKVDSVDVPVLLGSDFLKRSAPLFTAWCALRAGSSWRRDSMCQARRSRVARVDRCCTGGRPPRPSCA